MMNSTSNQRPLVDLPMIYLDWNIFDGLSKQQFNDLGELLLKIRDAGLVHIPYSEWHLYEAVNVQSDSDQRRELADRNINAINLYTNKVFIWENNDPKIPNDWVIGRAREEDKIDIEKAQLLVKISYAFTPIFQAFQSIRDSLKPYGLEPYILNNYTVDEAITKIDAILLEPQNIEKYKQYAPNGITFTQLLNISLSMLPSSTIEIVRIACLYIMIDLIGYYTDKLDNQLNLSLWRDSMHVAWASKAIMFISNDKRLRTKAKLTYQSLGLSTIVCDSCEAVPILEYIDNNADLVRAQLQIP